MANAGKLAWLNEVANATNIPNKLVVVNTLKTDDGEEVYNIAIKDPKTDTVRVYIDESNYKRFIDALFKRNYSREQSIKEAAKWTEDLCSKMR